MGKVETHANGKDILVHPLRLEDVIEEMDRLTESGFRFSIVPLEEVL